MTGNSIIVGIDGSTAARSALRWAADEARIRRRTLLIVHAPDFAEARLIALAGEPVVGALDALGERLLTHHAVSASARQPGVPVSTLLSPSSPAEALVELSLEADLLVVGRCGRGVAPMLGSVSHRVAARAHCPVAVVPDVPPPRDYFPAPCIAVGVSSTPAGRLALEFAFDEAHRRGATLSAVRAWQSADPWMLDGLKTGLLHQWQRQATQRLEHDLTPARSRHPEVHVDAHLATGDAAEALLGAARTAQLVVVGCHHSDARWMSLGPVPTAVLDHTTCPVVVVGQQRHPDTVTSTTTRPAAATL